MNTLSILYEDEWTIAVDKEAGHLVHPADEPQPDDVVVMKLVRNHCNLKIYPTHRLDRPTCGVLIFAKNKTTARALNRAFERKQVQKNYHAVVVGKPVTTKWSCAEPLQKSPDLPFKAAETDFRLLEYYPAGFSLLEARPHTGRYHQIRKHLLHCGYPIVGDYRYAGREYCEAINQEYRLNTRMLLQCRQLIFRHPHLEETMVIQAPLDPLFSFSR